MKEIEFNGYKLLVDILKTKKLYEETTNEDPFYLNYKKFCETLTNEEKEFFDIFGINPMYLIKNDYDGSTKDMSTYFCSGMEKDKTLIYINSYKIVGKLIYLPVDCIISADKLSEMTDEKICERQEMTIGRIKPSVSFESIMGEDENFITIQCFITMPWLLEQKCETKAYFTNFELLKFRIMEFKYKLFSRSNGIKEISKLLNDSNIKYEIMKKSDSDELVNKWYEKFMIGEKGTLFKKEFLNNKKVSRLLWEVFNFDLVKPLEGAEATKAFVKRDISECILYCSDLKLGFRIFSNFSKAKEISDNRVEFPLIDKDLKWLYVRTHEEGSGPFYYSDN